MASKGKNKAFAALLAAGGTWAWQNRDKIQQYLKSEDFRTLLKSPPVQNAVQHPKVQQFVGRGDVQTVLKSDAFKSLLSNPQFRSVLDSLVSQNTVQPTIIDVTPEPNSAYTGETRRLDPKR